MFCDSIHSVVRVLPHQASLRKQDFMRNVAVCISATESVETFVLTFSERQGTLVMHLTRNKTSTAQCDSNGQSEQKKRTLS